MPTLLQSLSCGQAGLSCAKERDMEFVLPPGASGAASPVAARSVTRSCVAKDSTPGRKGKASKFGGQGRTPPSKPLGDCELASCSIGEERSFSKPHCKVPTPVRARAAVVETEIDCDLPGERTSGAMIFPGDVLNIQGRYHPMTRLGASGGFMGHVLLAVSEARPFGPQSEVGQIFSEFCSDANDVLHTVSIVECTREALGLAECTLVLCTNAEGAICVCGEHDGRDFSICDEPEEIHIWQSPPKFRNDHFRRGLMQEVLKDMKAHQQNWSWSTAVRAFLLSGSIPQGSDKPTILEDIQDSWRVEPICSSIVVIFWQQYLHRLAQTEHIDSLHLILENMPVKADRVLPGELLCSLLAHGWTLRQTAPDEVSGSELGCQGPLGSTAPNSTRPMATAALHVREHRMFASI